MLKVHPRIISKERPNITRVLYVLPLYKKLIGIRRKAIQRIQKDYLLVTCWLINRNCSSKCFYIVARSSKLSVSCFSRLEIFDLLSSRIWTSTFTCSFLESRFRASVVAFLSAELSCIVSCIILL